MPSFKCTLGRQYIHTLDSQKRLCKIWHRFILPKNSFPHFWVNVCLSVYHSVCQFVFLSVSISVLWTACPFFIQEKQYLRKQSNKRPLRDQFVSISFFICVLSLVIARCVTSVTNQGNKWHPNFVIEIDRQRLETKEILESNYVKK